MGMEALTMACLMLVAGNPSLDVTPINQRAFDIPIRIDPARKSEIKELILQVSTDQGKTWNRAAVASPDQQQFPYQAPADGVYWFSIVTVDQQGKHDPPDPFQAPVGQKVLVDTLRPQLRIVSAERQSGGEVVVRWEIVDPHIDLATLRLQYRPADNSSAAWSPVGISPALAGQAAFRPSAPGPIKVRMEVQDQAQNPAEPAEADVAGGTVTGSAYMPSRPPDTPPPGWSPIPNQTHPPVVVQQEPPPRDRPDRLNPNSASWNNAGAYGSGSAGMLVASTSSPSSPVGPAARPPSAQGPARGPAVPLQVVNSNRVTLDYEVTKFGPSGVGSVELFVTRDDGRTWQPIGGEQNIGGPTPAEVQGPSPTIRRSLTVELPEDGIYGFHLVVRSGAGLGKPPPKNGDPPQVRVEVDRMDPEAELYRPVPDPSRRDTLILRWTARDRNLTSNPISLQWAQQPGGPWEAIGPPELPNTGQIGQYAWQVPAGMPPRVYLRLIVRDKAGNNGVAETPEPVLVDLTEPEVIFKVGGSGRQ